MIVKGLIYFGIVFRECHAHYSIFDAGRMERPYFLKSKCIKVETVLIKVFGHFGLEKIIDKAMDIEHRFGGGGLLLFYEPSVATTGPS